jgi:hypothetical protein
MRTYNEPAAEFTPMPMWFWNDALDEAEIRRQIEDFCSHEVAGFIIHPRIGLPRDIPYLSDLFLDHVASAVATAARLGMTVYLYDEGMYPSGSAHGQVAATDPAYAAQALIRQILPWPAPASPQADLAETVPDGEIVHERLSRDQAGLPVRIVYLQVPSGGTIRGIHFGEDSGQPDAPPAADLMNPAAMACFIRLTHERYYRKLAPYFGTTIRAFFTDEPSLLGRYPKDGVIPWTGDLLQEWIATGRGADDLEALFPESPDYDPQMRRQLDDLCRRKLSKTYYEPLARWCSEHDVALTGHPAQSDEIGLLRAFQIPGQDLVLRKVAPEDHKGLTGRDSTLAKCSADAARHAGKRRNAVECLGCCVRNKPSTGWDLPPEDMKWYLDWLAVRGVNLFIPHAFYYSLRGRRAAERPPDVGPAQTWWSEYAVWARYMRRLSYLLTDTVTLQPVVVLCRDDQLPWRVAQTLYEHQLDFNYLMASDLENGAARIEAGCLVIGPYAYDTLIIEAPEDFSEATCRQLQACHAAGIRILWPELPDSGPGDFVPERRPWLSRPGRGWAEALQVSAPAVAVSPTPLPDLRLTCQIRGGDRFILLVNEGAVPLDFDLICRIEGPAPLLWDPWSGLWSRVQSERCGPEHERSVPIRLPFRQSLVLMYPGAEVPVDRIPSCSPAGDLRIVRTEDLSRAWTMSGPGQAQTFLAELSEAGSWHKMPGLAHYSGTISYSKIFTAPDDAQTEIWLDLGTVGEAAAVWVNAEKIDTRFWAPYRYNITAAVRPGVNQLRVSVMNSISCRMDRAMKPSGLLGPVRLIITIG